MDENLLILHLARDKINQLPGEGSVRAWLFISNVILRLQGYFIFHTAHLKRKKKNCPERALICKGNAQLSVGPECAWESSRNMAHLGGNRGSSVHGIMQTCWGHSHFKAGWWSGIG